MKKLYLAGPDVFAPNPRELGAAKKEICRRHGLEGVFPFDVVRFDPALTPLQFGMAIFDALEAVMHGCDGVLVNMTPFHGLSMDVGTAFEMGFLRARGKPVFGYTNTSETLAERAARFWHGRAAADASGILRDPDHAMEVDSLSTTDNLMMDGCIARSTGILITGDVPGAEMFSNLGPFEQCVRAAAAWFETSGN